MFFLRTKLDEKKAYFLAIWMSDENNVLALRTFIKHISKKIGLYFFETCSHIWLSTFGLKTKLGDMTTWNTKLNQSPPDTHNP
jgi:hypothetical protein